MKVLFATLLFLAVTPLLAEASAQDVASECGRIYTGGPENPQPPEWGYDLPYEKILEIDDQRYELRYFGNLTNATADVDSTSITLVAEGESLLVRLPRALIDSSQGSQDVPFTVIVNGEATVVTEDVVPSTGDRMLCIPLSQNTSSNVEVIGTTIAPEFGSLTMIVAALGISSFVAFGAFRRRFF
jgi:hypothetical protein